VSYGRAAGTSLYTKKIFQIPHLEGALKIDLRARPYCGKGAPLARKQKVSAAPAKESIRRRGKKNSCRDRRARKEVCISHPVSGRGKKSEGREKRGKASLAEKAVVEGRVTTEYRLLKSVCCSSEKKGLSAGGDHLDNSW